MLVVPIMLNRLREKMDSSIFSLGMYTSRLGLSPTSWTVTAFLFAVGSSFGYASSTREGEILGGLGVLASGSFDVIDGAVARFTNRRTSKGAFLDSTLDRLAEVLVFLGILVGGHADPSLTTLALAFSLLVSYARARGESLGVALSGVGIGERAERLIILIMVSFIGLIQYGVIVVLLLAAVTFAQRIYTVTRSLR